MKIYLLSPATVPQNPCLFPTFINTFKSKGHSFVDRIEDSDILFLDLHTRISDYWQSDIDYVLKYSQRIITFCEWDRGNMSTDQWPEPLTHQQKVIFNHIENNNVEAVHFVRLLDKTKTYPKNVYPYEKAISYEEPLLTAEELFNREYDICWIANNSPSRTAIADAIKNYGGLKCNIRLGEPQIPFNDWVSENKKAKLFISAGAGGYTDQKTQALFSIAGIIREDNDQWLPRQFTHRLNCIIMESPPKWYTLDGILEVVRDKEWLYEIYKNGYSFMKNHYTEEAVSDYILDKLEANGIK